MAFGCMVGWGAFVMPGTTFLPLAGPAGTIIAMLISVAIILVIAYNYVFLIKSRPSIGGPRFTRTRRGTFSSTARVASDENSHE